MQEWKSENSEISEIAILGLGTAVPPYRMEQEDTSRRLTEALREAGYADSSRWAKRIFKQCGVETRYTCEPNLLEPAESCRYFPSAARLGEVPSTSERMAVYKQSSIPLAAEAARRALLDSGEAAESITHVITVSCTGQFLPGLDAALIAELGLSPSVARIPLTFLGCATGLKAVCLSKALIEGQRDSKALVVCVELCTLHIQPSSGKEALYGASFFGDGASACVVGVAEERHRDVFLLGRDQTVLLPDSAEEMIWEVGNNGFDLYLSPSIPRLIGEHVPNQITSFLGDMNHEELELWAIHPGGRGIVDVMQEMFGLSDGQTSASRSILRRYGNMSSATILFVLSEMKAELKRERDQVQKNWQDQWREYELGQVQNQMQDQQQWEQTQDQQQRLARRKEGIAVAFGPGVTAEMLAIAFSPGVLRKEERLDGVQLEGLDERREDEHGNRKEIAAPKEDAYA